MVIPDFEKKVDDVWQSNMTLTEWNFRCRHIFQWSKYTQVCNMAETMKLKKIFFFLLKKNTRNKMQKCQAVLLKIAQHKSWHLFFHSPCHEAWRQNKRCNVACSGSAHLNYIRLLGRTVIQCPYMSTRHTASLCADTNPHSSLQQGQQTHQKRLAWARTHLTVSETSICT